MQRIVTIEDLERALSKYLPAGTVKQLAGYIVAQNIHLKVTQNRSSKFGDYRPPYQGKGHRISINYNLKPQAFLVTLVHEIAHLLTWKKYQDRVDPHGKEWKQEFRRLMQPFLQTDIFPEPAMLNALNRYLNNPAASSCADPELYRILHHEGSNDGLLLLEELPENALFSIENGMTFRKGQKMRTRYRCMEVKLKRLYYVSGVARVEWIKDE